MILIVDDHLDTGTVLAKLLKRQCGHHAVAVASGAAALELLEGFRPTAIVLYVMMPGMSGLKVLRRVRADARLRGVPAVMFSAICSPALEMIARELGAVDFIRTGSLAWGELCDRISRHAVAGPPHPAPQWPPAPPGAPAGRGPA